MSGANTNFDAYHKWLGIPPAEQPPHHYRLLGIAAFESDADVIEGAAEQRMAHVRARQTGPHSALSQRLLNEISAASRTLLVADAKRAYDEQLRQQLAAAQPPRAIEPAQPLPSADPLALPETSLAAIDISPLKPTRRLPTPSKSSVPLIAGGAAGMVLIVLVLVAVIAQRAANQSMPVASLPSASPVRPAASPPPAPPPSLVLPQAAASETTPAEAESPPGEQPPPAPAPDPPAQEPSAPATAATPAPTPENEAPEADSPEAAPEPATSAADIRRPVPDEGALESARQAVKEVYGEEFAAAKSFNETSALAQQLLATARDSANDAERYALIDAARKMAELAGNLPLALQACDELALAFKITPVALKASVVAAVRKSPAEQPDWSRLVSAALGVVDEAIAADDYSAATEVGNIALEFARKTRDKEVIAPAMAATKRVKSLEAAYEPVRDEFAAVLANPNDAESHLRVGRFLCFRKEDWPAGLPHLAKGSDAALKELAELELAAATTPGSWLAVGDQWLQQANKVEPAEREAVRQHAGVWYLLVLPELTGLERQRVEKAIQEIGPVAAANVARTDVARRSPQTPKNDANSLLKLKGTWTVTYENGAIRIYEFDGAGKVKLVNLDNHPGRLLEENGDVLLDFRDGKVERLRFMNGALLVEHFNPASLYPDSPPLNGRGELTP